MATGSGGATDFDVAVIGAGYGGATVAALLAHAGRRVALVEKTRRAGGKTQTMDRGKYRYEMFGAVGIPAYNSRFHELVDRLGVAERVPFIILEGDVPSPVNPPKGCHFCTRCPKVMDICREQEPEFRDYGGGHYAACWLHP